LQQAWTCEPLDIHVLIHVHILRGLMRERQSWLKNEF
jgi:hypothetical protein